MCAHIFSEDHTKGLSTFTVMAGLGGFVGYSLGAINWEETAVGQFMGGNVKTVFSIVIVTLIATCIITLTSFREVPLPLMEKDTMLRTISYTEIHQAKYKNNNTILTLKEVKCIYHHVKQNNVTSCCVFIFSEFLHNR